MNEATILFVIVSGVIFISFCVVCLMFAFVYALSPRLRNWVEFWLTKNL